MSKIRDQFKTLLTSESSDPSSCSEKSSTASTKQPKSPEKSSNDSETKSENTTSESSSKVREKFQAFLKEPSTLRTKRKGSTPTFGSQIQTIHLGKAENRKLLYSAYHGGSSLVSTSGTFSRADVRNMYRSTVRRWMDDSNTAPFMQGRQAYQKDEDPDKLNPYSEKEDFERHLDWYGGWHHARHEAKHWVEGDSDWIPEDEQHGL